MKRIPIPAHLIYFFSLYIVSVALFTLFRLLLLITNTEQLKTFPDSETFTLLSGALMMGLRYDTTVTAYFLALPFLLFSATSFFNKEQAVLSFVHFWSFFWLSLFWLVCSIDIPFYNHFGQRLSTSVFAWTESPMFMLRMVFSEPRFFIFLLPFIAATIFLYFILKRLSADFKRREKCSLKPVFNFFIFLFFSGIILLAMRGRISRKSAINEGTAFFSSNMFANYLGLNPVFTLAWSIKNDFNSDNKKINLLPDSVALSQVQKYLGISGEEFPDYPLARKIIPEEKMLNANVALVIMEGMSTFWMGKYNGPQGLTPTLDSLSRNALYFDNIFTAGIHTHNGIYSTLFSFPALLKKQPMRAHFDFPHSGIAAILKNKGYHTLFFTTHDGQFDNTEGFLLKNGFNEVISEKHYPKKEILSTLGVPDHFMFKFSITKLNEIANAGQPFFAAYMTASNHSPNIIPENIDFVPKSENFPDKIIEYSDWAIADFLRKASQQSWFDNTIFIFIADHGLNMGHTYDMPLSFHHTPLIFHAPKLLGNPKTLTCMGGQIDLAPTLLGLLNVEYVNNTMGIDLLKEKRPCIFFSADNKLGCIDETHYYIYRESGVETLYEYANLSTENLIAAKHAKADSLRNYVFSMTQCADRVIENKQAGFIEFP